MRILTFDIEEWFHILDNDSTKSNKEWANFESRIHSNMDKIMGLLEATNQKATFFCLGWIARKYPDVIRRIDQLGYEIGTHSDMHQLVYQQSLPEFEEDLKRSIYSLEDITGKKITSYRAPGFSLKENDQEVFNILAKYGIESDSSIFPAARAHGGFPSFGISEPCIVDFKGISLKEFPINLRYLAGKKVPFIFSGGGYFRLLPYQLLDTYFKNDEYIMTYFHPRDFDPDQPMIKDLSLVRKFKSYYGLGGCLHKLKRLLESHQFTDMKSATEKIDWANVKIKKF
ncbi:MAG: polysaccharide deacetylase family protein [Chitinophaga sp.]|uniref:polysaccharide deacetylase family protein n=1 Tax=Chitinophaga sp. TaxID=1869181 RepID=UPI0025B95147|nr:polysaccharide deacetylase family protein [Chitinophaga sp.]MBV8254340.1 polysaccharide deacetylase family protein [Chitinophaga sp.]